MESEFLKVLRVSIVLFISACLYLKTPIVIAGGDEAKALKVFMKSQQNRSDWGIDFANVMDHSYIIAVNSSNIQGTTPQAKIKAMKEAELGAHELLVKFVHGI